MKNSAFKKRIVISVATLVTHCGPDPSFHGISGLVATPLTETSEATIEAGPPPSMPPDPLPDPSPAVLPTPAPELTLVYRDFTVNPEIAKLKPTVKFLLVIDDSNSMTPRRTVLESGVRALLSKVEADKYNLDIRLVSTADFTQTKVSFEFDEAGTTKTSATAPSPARVHKRITDFSIANPVFSTTYAFNEKMTQQQFTQKRDALLAKIRDIQLEPVPLNLRDTEKGICSALRAIKEENEGTRFVRAGDKFIVLFISDENSFEHLDAESCGFQRIENFVVEKSTGIVPCKDEVNCENRVYEYSVPYVIKNRQSTTLTYNATIKRIVDGAYLPTETATGSLSYICSPTNSSCTGIVNDSCNASQISLLKSHLKCTSASVCEFSLAGSSNNCKISAKIPAADANGTAAIFKTHTMVDDLCEKAENMFPAAASPDRIYDYAACKRTFVPSRSTRFDSNAIQEIHKLSSTETVRAGGAGIIDSFHQRARELFGDKGYRSVAIIRDPGADASFVGGNECPASPSKENNFSYGTQYRDLINRPGLDGQPLGAVYSICRPDYSPALNEVQRFIEEVLASTTIAISPAAGEKVSAVYILRGAEKIKVDPSKYTVSGASIQFADGVLEKTDQVVVEFARPNQV